MLIYPGRLNTNHSVIGGGRSYLPTDDGSDLAFWYDAEAYSGAALVQQWDDLSTNARHISQATSGNRPAYNATSFNGRPGITFTVDDLLQTAGSITLNTFKVIFIIANFTAGNGGILIEHGPNGFSSGGFYLINPASTVNGSWSVNDGIGPHYGAPNTGGTISGIKSLSFEYTTTGGVVKDAGVALSPAPTILGAQRINSVISQRLNVGARASLGFPASFTASAIWCLNRVPVAQDFVNAASFAARRI